MWTFVSGSEEINTESSFSPLRTFDPNAHPGNRYYTICWNDNNGNLWMYGGYGYYSGGLRNLADTWCFDGTY